MLSLEKWTKHTREIQGIQDSACLKSSARSWRDGSVVECLLLSQRTWVWFPESTSDSAQLPATSALGDLTPLAFIDTHTPVSIPYTGQTQSKMNANAGTVKDLQGTRTLCIVLWQRAAGTIPLLSWRLMHSLPRGTLCSRALAKMNAGFRISFYVAAVTIAFISARRMLGDA